MKNIIVLLIFLYGSHGVVLSQARVIESDQVHDNWKRIQTNKFSMDYPSSWTLTQDGQFGSELILFSPSDTISKEFRENISVLIENLADTSLTLEGYAIASQRLIKKFVTDIKINTSEPFAIEN